MPNKGLTITWVPNRQEGKALVTADLDGISIAEAILDLSDKAEEIVSRGRWWRQLPGIDPKQVEAELQRIASENEETTAIPAVPDRSVPKVVARLHPSRCPSPGCDESYIALPLLTMLAAAVGNSRCIRLKRTWCEPAMIWAVVVGESGLKSLARPGNEAHLSSAERGSKRIQNQMVDYREKALLDAELAEWKKSRKKGLPHAGSSSGTGGHAIPGERLYGRSVGCVA